MTDVLVVPPTVEPLTRTTAKLHLRSRTSTEDALVDAYIAGARGHVETFTRRALVLQTRRLFLDRFPACIELPIAPARAVTSLQYVDTSGVLQTLDEDLYQVDTASEPARIVPAYGETWPATQDVLNAVRVTYTAGMLIPFTADAAADLLSASGHGFADGDVTQVQTLGGSLPTGLAIATGYFVRDAADDSLKLAATSGGAAVDITAAGTAPNVLGHLDPEITQALQLLVQYLEQRDGNAHILEAAEGLLMPIRARMVRF